LLAAVAILALALPAHAQFAPPGNQPDLALDARARAAVVDTLADRLERLYVFPEKGRAMAKALRQRQAAKRFEAVTSAEAFADTLTSVVQSLSGDLHVRVRYRHEPLPVQTGDGRPPEGELRRLREEGRRTNYGFDRVQRLPGNVGYLELRGFSGDPDGQTVAVAAMNFLANSDALIVDLRRNGGGSPAMIQTLITYLTPENDRLHINDFYQRETDTIVQFWTASHVPGPRLAGKPLYVLTSRRTFSAAEEFAYDVQNLKLGTLVGEVTGGGAHPGGMVRVHEHFACFIPTGRAINPVTRTNWEGIGVKPEVEVRAGDALRTAHVAAVKQLLERTTDEERRDLLRGALELAEKTPSDPEEDFARPGARRTTGR
jgi:hypothetical protein